MKRFNVIYNNNDLIGLGKGYYVIFENHEGNPTVDCVYPSWEHNEMVDVVSVGLWNKIKYLIEIGYKLDIYYTCDLKELF